VAALARKKFGMADPLAVERTLEEHAPDLAVNAAAFTNVDGCETELACSVNALGPRNLAQVREERGCELLPVGPRYAFDGGGLSRGKGVAGEWRSVFTEGDERVFEDAGNLLIELGCGKDLDR
jgi:dTDP-4-dehydrorhamnose reductase